MKYFNFHVEVSCRQPNWAKNPQVLASIELKTPDYRLYIDDDLITERTWIWSNETKIEENVLINSVVGAEHTVKLLPVLTNIAQARFKLLNFTPLGSGASYNQISDTEITFKIQ